MALRQFLEPCAGCDAARARRHVDGWSRGNHAATARTDTNGARACGAPVGAAGFVVEVVRLINVGAFWHRHTRGIICVRGSGARLRHALRTRVLLSTSQSQASARFVCDFGWRGMRRARATGDVGKGVGLVVTKRIDDGDATRRYGYDRIVTCYKNDVPGRCVGAVVG